MNRLPGLRGLSPGHLPPPTGMTFTVYITKDGLVFRWGWEKSHEQTLTYPENYQTRYGPQLWPKT